MANNTCRGVIQACMTRTALLDEGGEPTGGANSGYISDAIIELGINMVVKEGEEKEQRNGCDAICQTLTNPDRISRIDLSLNLCQLDAELLQFLTGGTLITPGGDTIGHEWIGPTDDISANGVSFEVYAKSWDGAEQGDDGSGNVEYVHFVFPRTRWVMGNMTVNADYTVIPVTGKASTNSSHFNGGWNDLPYNFTKLGGWFLDSDLPTAVCGRVTLPVGS